MNFLAGYDSNSDDGSDGESAPIESKPVSMPTIQSKGLAKNNKTKSFSASSSSNAKIKPKSKTKKLDYLSILPPEIATALMRGDTSKDSDDDEEEEVTKKKSSSIGNKEPIKGSSNLKDGACPLLSMLTAPVNDPLGSSSTQSVSKTLLDKNDSTEQINDNIDKEATHSTSDMAVNDELPSKPKKSSFNFSYQNTSDQKRSINVHDHNNDNKHSTQAIDDVQPAVERKVSKRQHMLGKMPSVPGPSLSSFLAYANDTSSQQETIVPTRALEVSVPVSSGQPPLQQPTIASNIDYNQIYQQEQREQKIREQQREVEQFQREQQCLNNWANIQGRTEGSSDTVQGQKRRQRDIEQQLMSGNLSAVQESGGVRDITIDNKWDQQGYTQQQEMEAAVQKEYGKYGTGGVLVNKVQSRKHQLSSLAVKAAQTELAMLDARGKRMKTKAETQGKYGW